jgi:hypothetical protein
LALVYPRRASPYRVSIMCANRSPGVISTPCTCVLVAGVPPVVPHARLDDGRLAFAEDAGLAVQLQSQLALEHRNALDQRGVEMLADDTRADRCGQLRGRASIGDPCREARGWSHAHRCDRVLPNLSDLYWRQVSRTVWIRMRHLVDAAPPHRDRQEPSPFVLVLIADVVDDESSCSVADALSSPSNCSHVGGRMQHSLQKMGGGARSDASSSGCEL